MVFVFSVITHHSFMINFVRFSTKFLKLNIDTFSMIIPSFRLENLKKLTRLKVFFRSEEVINERNEFYFQR